MTAPSCWPSSGPAGSKRKVRSDSTALATINTHTNNVDAAAFGPYRTLLDAGNGGFDRIVRLWDISDPAHPKMLTLLDGHSDKVTMLTISKGPNDSDIAAVVSSSGKVQLWDITNPNRPSELDSLPRYGSEGWALAVSPDGRWLATGAQNGSVDLLDVSPHR